jgi:drug/metabolite transporter (DMT)-like permease
MEALPSAAALGVATAIAFICFYEAIRRIGSSRTSVASMLEPVATVVLAFIVLGEAITGRVGVGAALIVAALPVLALTRRGPSAAPEGP